MNVNAWFPATPELGVHAGQIDLVGAGHEGFDHVARAAPRALGAVVEHEAVGPVPAVHDVLAGAADQHVVAAAAGQGVVALAAIEDVVPRIALDRVVLRISGAVDIGGAGGDLHVLDMLAQRRMSGRQNGVHPTAGKLDLGVARLVGTIVVVARTAIHDIGTEAPVEDVVSVSSEKGVVAAAAVHRVVAAETVEDVVAGEPGDRILFVRGIGLARRRMRGIDRVGRGSCR